MAAVELPGELGRDRAQFFDIYQVCSVILSSVGKCRQAGTAYDEIHGHPLHRPQARRVEPPGGTIVAFVAHYGRVVLDGASAAKAAPTDTLWCFYFRLARSK
jgi:hypothetical protein